MLLTAALAALVSMQAAPTEIEPTSQEAEAASPTAEAAKPAPLVVEEERVKITDRNHPDYVRCRSEAVIGSRAKRKRTCMKNSEWAIVAKKGNDLSREFLGDNQAGFSTEGH